MNQTLFGRLFDRAVGFALGRVLVWFFALDQRLAEEKRKWGCR